MLILVNYYSHELDFLLNMIQSNIWVANIIVNIINMVNCLAIGCTGWFDTPSQEDINFHKIPSSKKQSLRQKWLNNILCKTPLLKDLNF